MSYYVYILRRPSGEPFYVGMGSGKRITVHEKNARLGEKSHKANIIRKIWSAGENVRREFVEEFGCADEASALEISLISAIGRADLGKGPLVNKTDGGDGVRGMSQEARERHSSATKEAMAKPGIVESCRAHMQRLWQDADWAEAALAHVRKYWSDPSNRMAQSKRTMAFAVANPEWSEAMKIARKVAQARPEVREKMRLAKLGKKQSPEAIARRMASRAANLLRRQAEECASI